MNRTLINTTKTRGILALALAATALSSGCGYGVLGAAAIAAAAGSGGSSGSSSSNASAVLTNFAVTSTAQSPAKISFTLSDAESDPTRVELRYRIPKPPNGSHFIDERAKAFVNAPSVPFTLDTDEVGVDYTFDWEFVDEDFLPDDGSMTADVLVYAVVEGGPEEPIEDENADEVDLGNDAPAIADANFAIVESQGSIDLPFTVSDSSSDPISVRVEFRRIEEGTAQPWMAASPTFGLPASELAFEGVDSSPEGVGLVFPWATGVDLPGTDTLVELRITALDEYDEGAPFVSDPFRVDNNQTPNVSLAIGKPKGDDRRRGVVLPLEVSDAEGDTVGVVVQWTRPGLPFPPLPTGAEALAKLLDDPEARSEARIASAFRTGTGGRIRAATQSSAVLPELSSTASTIVSETLIGRPLEVLRGSLELRSLREAVAGLELSAPVGVAALGDGREVLVLEPGSAADTWSLRRLELATGMQLEQLAEGVGAPRALSLDAAGQGALVASSYSDAWMLARVELDGGAVQELYTSPPTNDADELRGLASLSPARAAVTVGTKLFRIDLPEGLPPIARAVGGPFAGPWGVAADPLDPNAVFVAERNGDPGPGNTCPSKKCGRLWRVDLTTGERAGLGPIVAGEAGQLLRPEALAIAPGGGPLFVAARRKGKPDSAYELFRVDLGALGGNRSTSLGALPGNIASIAAGPDQLVVAALPATDDLAFGGGLEQVRSIETVDLARTEVTVDESFDPLPAPGHRWRVPAERSRRETPAGSLVRYVWDSAELPLGGVVRLRATPYDADTGASIQFQLEDPIHAALDAASTTLGNDAGDSRDAAAADLDGDGDLDLALARPDGIELLYQVAPRVFESGNETLWSNDLFGEPHLIRAGDLDADGDADLAVAVAGPAFQAVALFFQQADGSFSHDSDEALDGAGLDFEPAGLALADFDRDGDLDIATAQYLAAPLGGDDGSGVMLVFLQVAPGSFQAAALANSVRPGLRPLDLEAALANDDGRIDLMLAERTTAGAPLEQLTLLTQPPTGAFEEAWTLPANIGLAATFGGDVDRDGDRDVIAVGEDGLVLYEAVAPNTFQDRSLGDASLSDGALFDTDKRGALELVGSGADSGEFHAFAPGVVGGGAEFAAELGSEGTNSGSAWLVAEDVDGDGRPDLIGEGPGGPRALFAVGGGEIAAVPEVILAGGALGDVPRAIEAVDWSGDGALDLAVAAGDLRLFVQTPDGEILAAAEGPIGGTGSLAGVFDVAAADFDGDGRADLATANALGDTATVFLQGGAGFGAAPDSVLVGLGAETPSAIEAADLDRDGTLDLAVLNSTAGNLSIYLQDGAGGFESGASSTLGSPVATPAPSALAVGDLDLDGDVDVVVATAARELAVFEQAAPGLFSSAAPIELAALSLAVLSDIELANVDGDADLEVLITSTDGLFVAERESSGAFAARVLADAGLLGADFAPRSVAVADGDGDGDFDVVTGQLGARSRSFLHLQTSPGVFRPEAARAHPQLLPFHDASDVLYIDIDGDGDPDIVSTEGAGEPRITVSFGSR